MDDVFADIDGHTEEYLARLKRALAQPSIAAEGSGIAGWPPC
jgi:hypothetical protein